MTKTLSKVPQLFTVCVLFSVAVRAQSITANEAAKHIGEQTTVCGQIADKHTADNVRGKPTFIDLEQSFPHQVFTLVIWDSDKSKVGDLPSSGNVCVTGKITEYKGVPQVVLHDAKSWTVSISRSQ